MKPSIRKAVALALCCLPSAYAATSAGHDGSGLFFWLFIGFATFIITFHLLPGITTFLSMTKGLFSSGAKVMTGAQSRNAE